MAANFNSTDVSEWKQKVQQKFSEQKVCGCCGLKNHSIDKCHKLCRLNSCFQKYLSDPDGNYYHKFHDCQSEEHKICSRCGKGGHFVEECFTPQCHHCGLIGHIRPNCPELDTNSVSPPSYQSFMLQQYNYMVSQYWLQQQQQQMMMQTMKWSYDPYSYSNPIVYEQ
jgi:hypothetical protein